MDISTVVFGGLAAALVVYSLRNGGPAHAAAGLRSGLVLFIETVPRLLLGFIVAGFIPLLVPKEVIARWLGDAAGFRGIVAGAAVGALSPGGPFLNFPILAGFYQAGAGVGPIAAFITSWSIFGLHRILLWELPLLGPRLTFARLLISVPMPFLVGVAARAVYVRWLT